jgi:hypothetical protein
VGKAVDDSWKDSVGKEKAEGDKPAENRQALQADFTGFISSLAMEALIFLGEIPNPISKKKEVAIDQARYIIDILGLLKERTKGNLTAKEANAIDNILYELRAKFVAKKG